MGEGVQNGMQVKENECDEWQLFYDEIEGFTFEEGYVYEVAVGFNDVRNPPADGVSKK